MLVTGTGPPGPPRLREPECVLAGAEDLEEGFWLAAVSGEEGIVEGFGSEMEWDRIGWEVADD